MLYLIVEQAFYTQILAMLNMLRIKNGRGGKKLRT